MASSKALDLFYWVTCAALYRRIAMFIEMASKVVVLINCRFVQLPGQYGASSGPMAASIGIRVSPGYAALGNAVCIAHVHHHDHRNGQQWRCIRLHCSLFSIIIHSYKTMLWSIKTNAELQY